MEFSKAIMMSLLCKWSQIKQQQLLLKSKSWYTLKPHSVMKNNARSWSAAVGQVPLINSAHVARYFSYFNSDCS